MSKIYPNLEYLSERENEHHRSTSDLETNCGQIFSKSSAFTRDIIEKLEETELGPKNTIICGHEFRTRQLWGKSFFVAIFLFTLQKQQSTTDYIILNLLISYLFVLSL